MFSVALNFMNLSEEQSLERKSASWHVYPLIYQKSMFVKLSFLQLICNFTPNLAICIGDKKALLGPSGC
jgi:hypothetical protein